MVDCVVECRYQSIISFWLSSFSYTTVLSFRVLCPWPLTRNFVQITTFFDKCYSWGATSEYRLKIGAFAPTGSVWPKIVGRRGRPPPTFLGTSFFLFVRNHTFDRRTDRQTDWRMDGQTDTFLAAIVPAGIPCSAVKKPTEIFGFLRWIFRV